MKRIYIKPKIEELVCDNEQFLCASYSANLDGVDVGVNGSGNGPDGARTDDPFFEEDYDEY